MVLGTGVGMSWEREHDIDTALATLKSAVEEQVKIRAAIQRRRSRVLDDIQALEATLRKVDIHCVETPDAASIRATLDRLWQFCAILDEHSARSLDIEARLQKQASEILKPRKSRKHA